MRKIIKTTINDTKEIKKKLFLWANNFSPFVFLDSNQYSNNNSSSSLYPTYECIAAVGKIDEIFAEKSDNFQNLKRFYDEKQDWLFGALTYDLKNECENLSSENIDKIEFPTLHFFQALIVVYIKDNIMCFEFLEQYISENEIFEYINQIKSISVSQIENKRNNTALSRYSKKEYLQTILKIKENIGRGDIYEMNLCQEFYIENFTFNPISTYQRLIEQSPSPFSCFYHLNNHYLLSASPERFIKKQGNKIISQPIKGTAKRNNNIAKDNALKQKLLIDPKERVENIMITDLVRNDLSKTAIPGSVKVEELCKVYSFQQAHQMISTIISKKDNKSHVIDVIKEAFPMGSMTGAPKVKAMELIEKYEKSKRGLFSGTVGYFSPNGDFDFNVIIRSIIYNQEKKYVSFSVGSAITHNSNPEKEYEECMIKAKPMMNVLNIKKINNV